MLQPNNSPDIPWGALYLLKPDVKTGPTSPSGPGLEEDFIINVTHMELGWPDYFSIRHGP